MDRQKALELLRIPNECGVYEGQIQTKTNRYLVIEEVNDFTTGKRVITNNVRVEESTQLFGAYTFNLISAYLHAYGHDVVGVENGVFKTYKPQTVNGGYWFGWERAEIVPTNTGYSFDVISNIGVNATATGAQTDPNNPPVRAGVVYKVQVAITKSADGTIKRTTFKKKYVPYTVNQLVALTGMSSEEISYATRVSFNIVPVNPETHVTSIAMDIEATESTLKGIFHINGVPANSITQPLIASYGKVCPSYVFRWILYNSTPTTPTVFGQSALATFDAMADNTITYVSGITDGYDSASKTLTFNAGLSSNATIVATAEFLPAQGKNETAGMTYGLETGLKDLY